MVGEGYILTFVITYQNRTIVLFYIHICKHILCQVESKQFRYEISATQQRAMQGDTGVVHVDALHLKNFS